MALNPVQAANILLGVWQVLHDQAGGPARDEREPAATPVEERPSSDRLMREQRALEERVDRVVLLVHAMWTLVSEKMEIADADLIKRMTELDGADGTVDGRVSAPPVRCSCGAMVCRKMGRCLFCGKPHPAGTAFETL